MIPHYTWRERLLHWLVSKMSWSFRLRLAQLLAPEEMQLHDRYEWVWHQPLAELGPEPSQAVADCNAAVRVLRDAIKDRYR